MKRIKFFLALIVAFVLGYLDEVALAGVKIGVLWKAIVLILTIMYLARKLRRVTPQFAIGGVLFFKSLVYAYAGWAFFVLDAAESLKFLLLPVLIEFFIRADKKTAEVSYRFLLYFIPLSVIPFILGLQPLQQKESHSLAIYGVYDAYEFSGIFGNKHNAAVAMACASILVYHELSAKRIGRTIAMTLLALTAYGLYMTYTRTGLLALMSGVLVYVVSANSRRMAIIKLFGFAAVFSFALALAWNVSDTFRQRLLGQNIYVAEASASALSSGRLDFWTATINESARGDLSEILLGVGLEASKNDLERYFGLHIFAHNGFLDALRTSGIIGFLLFVWYWTVLFTMARRAHTGFQPVLYSLWGLLMSVQIVQGGHFIWAYATVAVAFGIAWRRGIPAPYVTNKHIAGRLA